MVGPVYTPTKNVVAFSLLHILMNTWNIVSLYISSRSDGCAVNIPLWF